MIIPVRFGFYGILTNPVKGYEYLAKVMVDFEVKFIQLRMKDAPEADVLKTAEAIRKITANTKSLFIVNDSPEVAKAVDADGVHLGQEDMDIDDAREILGRKKLIGLSTHNIDQTKAACAEKPAYIGVGPVYETPTKAVPDPVIGLKGMEKMLRAAKVPAVAIGAIDANNLPGVIRAGAVNFSSVRPVNQSDNPEKALKKLLTVYWQETNRL